VKAFPFLFVFLALAGCSVLPHTAAQAVPLVSDLEPSNTPFLPVTSTSIPSRPPTRAATVNQKPTELLIETFFPETPVPTRTPKPPTRTPRPTKTPEFTPTWAFNPAGEVTAPILVYHHIVLGDPQNLYSVSVDIFRKQMEALHDFGYTAIPISLLVQAITQGAELPPRPVVITFDDGNRDIYENAFPILQEMGFVATMYLIDSYLDSGGGSLSIEQAQDLLAAGWEFGSHSMTHSDLTGNHDILWYEIKNSRKVLEERIGAPVQTFAYPFGAMDAASLDWARNSYTAAVGLGVSSQHWISTLFYLSRFDMRSTVDMAQFINFLPWKDQSGN